MTKDTEADDFELNEKQLKYASAALSNHGFKRGSEIKNKFSLNRFNYLKALKGRANQLFNLVLLGLKSDHANRKISNDKF